MPTPLGSRTGGRWHRGVARCLENYPTSAGESTEKPPLPRRRSRASGASPQEPETAMVDCSAVKAAQVKEATRPALAAERLPRRVLDRALIPAADMVGREFSGAAFCIPEMLIAARAMQAGVSLLMPHPAQGGAQATELMGVRAPQGEAAGSARTNRPRRLTTPSCCPARATKIWSRGWPWPGRTGSGACCPGPARRPGLSHTHSGRRHPPSPGSRPRSPGRRGRRTRCSG